IFDGRECVGYVTSGGYGHTVGRSLAMGYVPTPLAADGTKLRVELLGEFYDAVVTAQPLYDPDGVRMRN
ncbi:MAG: aminomethyl transferase family protein, partial [Mesorhizobium sp.]